MARFSVDGVTWASTAWPEMRAGGDGDLAGGEHGAVSVGVGSPNRLVFTADCGSWQEIDLPGTGRENVTSVSTYRGAFVAVGDSGTELPSPVAWWSIDGLGWTPATVEVQPGEGLTAVYAGLDGLVARGRGDYGKGSLWTSSEGRTWRMSDSPLNHPQGSSPTLVLVADGTRFLGYGSSGGPDGGPVEHWISFDGIGWDRLDVSGADSITENWITRPFVLRDSVLFSQGSSDDSEAWLGIAGS